MIDPAGLLASEFSHNGDNLSITLFREDTGASQVDSGLNLDNRAPQSAGRASG